MRKVIKGKLYDTETAELLYSWSNAYPINDFKARLKDLYQTKNGALFLLHDGGPMTDMAVSCGQNSWQGSSDIEPISKHDAMAFLESHGGTSIIIDKFPDAAQEA